MHVLRGSFTPHAVDEEFSLYSKRGTICRQFFRWRATSGRDDNFGRKHFQQFRERLPRWRMDQLSAEFGGRFMTPRACRTQRPRPG